MMLHSLVATSPVQSGGIRFLHSLLSALYEARAQRAREEITRHADLIAAAPWGRASAEIAAERPGTRFDNCGVSPRGLPAGPRIDVDGTPEQLLPLRRRGGCSRKLE